MKLSMWMLMDALADKHPTGDIKDGAVTIEGFRLFSDREEPSGSYVYIGRAAEFFGDKADKVCLVHRRDVIVVEHVDVADIINLVICTFEKYRIWDEKLQTACHEPQPYQAILDIAHEMFQCPMFFGNKNLHIYALTYQYGKEEVYDEWDDVKALKTMPIDLIKRVGRLNVTHQMPDDIDPAVMPIWPGMRFKYQIRTNCHQDGSIWGHFYLYYNKDVSPSIPQLTKHVAGIYSRILQETQEKNSAKSTMYSWLIDILEGHPPPSGTLQTIYWSQKWSETDTLVLYKIASSGTVNEKTMFYWLCDSIIDVAAGAAVFPYERSIVVIVRDTSNQSGIVLDHITRLISLNGYRCGVSFTFQGLEKIESYYRQAGYAIEHAPDSGSKVHYYKDCTLTGLASEIKSHLKWQNWVPPALLRLAEMDASQGTEYYVTLYYLLVNKWHLGNTAKALFIHRNTLLYRLDKIGNLMDVDIHDESVCAYLRICFDWLMAEYPVNVLPPTKDCGCTE